MPSADASLNGATQTYVSGKLASGPARVAAVGGQSVTAVGALPNSAGYKWFRGADRYATAASLASAFNTGDPVGVAICTLTSYRIRWNSRPAMSTPTIVPSASRVKQPRCPARPPSVMM